MDVIDAAGRAPLIDAAAQIWAEATAARDGRDQVPALALYQRLGWQAAGLPAAHPETGKPEQRYELRLKPP